MKRFSCTVFLVSLFVAAISCVVLSRQASALMFNFVINDLSPNSLRPLARITHDSGLDLFDGFTRGTAGDDAISLFSGTTPSGGTCIITPSYVWGAGREVNSDDVAQIKAIPASIPAPLFLLGTGLVGLACANGRKSFKR